MFSPCTILFFCVCLFTAGCSRQADFEQATGKPVASVPALAEPLTTQDSARPVSNLELSSSQILQVDTDPPSGISQVVRSIFQDSTGKLWIGTQEGLYCHDGDKLICYLVVDDFGKGVTIKQVVEDSDGSIWCATSGGVTKIDGQSYQSFGEKDGLVSRDVWSIAVDATGMIWIGTIEGACRFDGKDFTALTLPEAEPDPTRGVTSGKIVHCITVDRKGQVWFGTNGGAYTYDGESLANISENDGLANDAVYRILEDKSGNIWFGTTHNGVCRFDGTQFTNFTADGVVTGKEIWSMHEDSSDNVWFSGKRFGVYCYDGNRFTNFNKEDGIDSPGIMSILEDNQGRLWLGGTGGLFRRNGDSFVRVTTDGLWD